MNGLSKSKRGHTSVEWVSDSEIQVHGTFCVDTVGAPGMIEDRKNEKELEMSSFSQSNRL